MAEQHHVAPMKDHNDDDAAADDHHPDQQQEKKGEVHHNDNEHHSGGGDERRLYNHPMQRQKWGDPQVLPHTDWGATFFDLFYVAAAYNLGNIIRYEPTSRGLFYFVGLFSPIMFVWTSKMSYQARFCVGQDVFHRVYEYFILVALGTAVLFIRPVEIMEDPNNYDLFAFSLTITVCHLLSMGRMVEVRFLAGKDQPAALKAASRDMKWYTIAIIFMITATIISGVAFCSNDNNETLSNSTYPGTDNNDDDGHKGGTTTNLTSTGNRLYRVLAESTTTPTSDYNYSDSSFSTKQTDAAIWLLIAGGVGYQILLGVMVLCLPKDGKHKEISVPMNIEFCIHRFGEFVMVMLGESVLSLLIVVVPETADYYTTFFFGIISITLLEYLHFRSQPHDPNDHAMRRSKEAGVAFNALMFVYCGALVILGVSYKMVLYEFAYESYESSTTDHRSLLLGSGNSILGRLLAGGGSDVPKYDTPERHQQIANFFSGSMAVVWLCSDLMILTHHGIKAHFQKCSGSNRTFHMRVFGWVLLLIRIGMLAFIATLSQYYTDPQGLAIIGLCGILFQVILRMIGTFLYGPVFDSHNHDNIDADEDSQNIWPNVTRPEVAHDTIKQEDDKQDE